MSAKGDESKSLKDLRKHNGRPSPKVAAKKMKTNANSSVPAVAAASASASPSSLILPKIEPGTSSSSARLPSFRTPRELSLSGLNFPASFAASNLLPGTSKQKRVFVPNIPVKREKSDAKASTGRSDRGRGRGGAFERGGRGNRGGRGRGRGRGNNLVQMKGLWAEGVSSVANRNSSGGPSSFGGSGGGGGGLRRSTGRSDGGGGGGGSVKAEDGVMQRPVVTGESMVVDKDEEEQCLSMLLGDGDDDFEDDDESSEFYERFCKPMCLALDQVKEEPSAASAAPEPSTPAAVEPLSDQPKIKVEPDESPTFTNGHTSEMSNGMQPPVAAESSKTNVKAGEPPSVPLSVGDIFAQNKRAMFLWQLPKTLPSIVSRDVPPPTAKPGPSSGTGDGGDEEGGAKKASEYCRLGDLPPGQIGFVKVYKSGRAELCLGDYALPITLGCKKAHLEEVVHVSIDEGRRTGKLAVLGRIEQRLLMRPPFDKLVDLTRCSR